MDYLPHQEAKIKAGLEKAIQHKDKLLEFDKNRYTPLIPLTGTQYTPSSF